MTSFSGLPKLLLPAVLIWFAHFEDGETTTTADYQYYYYDAIPPDYGDFDELCVKESNRQFRVWFIPTFSSVISVLGLAGNLLVICTVLHFKRLKTMTDVYLLNLSCADLLLALSLPFWAFNAMAEWALGLAVCKAIHAAYKVSLYSGMIFLSAISVDRFFAVAKAVSSYRHRSQAMFLSKVSSAAIWATALIFSIPEMTYTTINVNTCTPYSGSSDRLRINIQATQIALGFVLPLAVMSFCYSAIVRTLYQARTFDKNRAIKVILAVVAAFLVTQVPYNLVLFWTTVVTAQGGTEDCSYENSLLYATDVTQYVAFLRCCLDPFVYAFVGVKFRRDLLRLLKDAGCPSRERRAGSRGRTPGATDNDTSNTLYT